MRPFIRPFIAFISKQTDCGFRVTFPDLPHCDSTGRSIEEARQNAEKTLAMHCRRLRRTGEPLPRASYMHQIVVSQERGTDGLVTLIRPPEAA